MDSYRVIVNLPKKLWGKKTKLILNYIKKELKEKHNITMRKYMIIVASVFNGRTRNVEIVAECRLKRNATKEELKMYYNSYK